MGEVALPFGANKPGGGGRTIGLFFSARPFASVYAPWQGRISFADKMDRFGVVVMIDIGEGGQLMLVGLSETDRKAGELVLAGEPVGRLGGPRGRSDDFMSEASAINLGAMSSLYFEFRRNGEPTDPAPWLESGQLR